VEWLSKVDDPLISKDTPLKAFTNSLPMTSNFGVVKIKGLDSQVIPDTLVTTLGRVQELFSQVGKVKHKEDV
jgi:hypothetical protein